MDRQKGSPTFFAEKPQRQAQGRGRAGEGTRTLDINLGKVALYQLSYTRRVWKRLTRTEVSSTLILLFLLVSVWGDELWVDFLN